MKKMYFAVLLVALSSMSTAFAGDLKFKSLGFELDSLNPPATQSFTILQQFLPSANGFAPNVNVLLQKFEESLTSYDKLSKSQFKQLNMEVLHQQRTKDSLTYEYTGILQGAKLHFYSKAFKKGNSVYLVTATDSEETWHKNAKKLKANVDSFKFN